MISVGFEIEGLEELSYAVGVMREALTAADQELAARALFSDVGAEPNLVEAEFTLERAVASSFATEGRNRYRGEAWTRLDGEPIYLAHKIAQGGGTKVGIWRDSTDGLSETFKAGNPDHIAEVTRVGPYVIRWRWGSKRGYASRFHRGHPEQRWDGIPQPARPILPPGGDVAFRYAKSLQRLMVRRLQQRGEHVGTAMRSLRVEP